MLAACAAHHPPRLPRLTPAAERIFHADPRWLGGDAALTIDLGNNRILWLFGDSFIDLNPPYTRKDAAFARNTIAVETGRNPESATMSFVWRQGPGGEPASFFPDTGKDWYWPGSGLVLPNGPLAIVLHRWRATGAAPPLGFESAGYALVLIDNPGDAPSAWHGRIVPGPALPFDALPGAALIADGADIVVLATRTRGMPAGMLMRVDAAALADGDLTGARWWTGAEWRPTALIGTAGPAIVIDDAGSESSLHAAACGYVHVTSTGFGAATIVARTAPALTGPWSAPTAMLRPPESDAPEPFVYAGRAHPDLAAPPGALRVSYVPSSLSPETLLTDSGTATLYWPRLALAASPC
jgi:hypothetical protein